MAASLDALLADLESVKNHFGEPATGRIKRLLLRISRHEFDDARLLIRYHEALLFLRAFPLAAGLIAPVEKQLNTFHARIERLHALGANMSAFDDFDTSGIAGTTMQDSLNFEAARWLIHCIPRAVEIAWDEYDDERAMGAVWPHFIPLLREDADVEANIPWRHWFGTARGRMRDAEWLIRRFERIQQKNRAESRTVGDLYDSMRLPLRWHLKNLKLSRTRNWTRPRKFFFHTQQMITRREVSLAEELSRPAPQLERLSRSDGDAVIEKIREVMLVRYRELYGTTLGDASSVRRADLGRGVVMHLWNLPPERRLPLRAYVAGFTLKNGVPINYIEAIGLCEWIEVGFNTFYTYRQGETAWIYAQALRCLCALTGAKTISVYPYQIGQNNDEALDSGAFWFYRKLGFRSGDRDLEKLARGEEEKISRSPRYRTPRRILKRLAEAHVFYELDGAQGRPWDKFSTRNLGLLANRRMAREFNGEMDRIRETSVKETARALRLNHERWTDLERQSLGNWSLVLALIPGLERWAPEDKRAMSSIIRAQAGANEMHYLHLTQRHARLRAELLKLGC